MASEEELFWQVALTLVPGIGCVTARCLLDHFGSAREVFRHARACGTIDIPGAEAGSNAWANRISAFRNFAAAEQTLAFALKYHIHIYCLSDPDFPERLREARDGPAVIYYKGSAALNDQHFISVAGTRGPNVQARLAVREIIRGLSGYDVIIASGMAEGVDAFAHRSALKNGLLTVGVLAHGLDTLYPPQHRQLARDMLDQGGLLTECREGTAVQPFRFVRRNRILAAMSEAMLIISCDETGSSMITARMAQGYNNAVFAVPGRPSDVGARGCNQLIRDNVAALVTCAADIVKDLNWKPLPSLEKSTMATGNPINQ